MNQAHYDRCIANGCSPRLAEMLASCAAPRVMTDSVAFEGVAHADPMANIPPQFHDYYRQRAEEAGVSIKGKKYVGRLADSPGDPRAWVSTRGEAKKVLEERGWSGEGMVNVAPAMDDTPDPNEGPYEVAPDIVESYVETELAKNPEMAVEFEHNPQAAADYTEKVTKTLSGQE